MLRAHGVVDKFVEFCGRAWLPCRWPDRATIANMAPEYGATVGFFPVDEETLRYLRLTGRPEELVELRRALHQGAGPVAGTERRPLRTSPHVLELDLATVEPSLAGPKRPQDRVPLSGVRQQFRAALGAADLAGWLRPCPAMAQGAPA